MDAYDVPADSGWPRPGERARALNESWALKSRLKDQSKANRRLAAENAELRRRVDRLDAVDYGGVPEPPADPTAATEPAPDAADTADLRAQVAEAQAQVAELERQPVGIPPEVQRSMELVSQAQASASAPADGVEGLLARMKDRSVPYPQLVQEMRAYGFRQPDEPRAL